MQSAMMLDIKKSFHFHMVTEWEKEIISYAKHPFWIGINKWKDLEHIPNSYEFTNFTKKNKSIYTLNIQFKPNIKYFLLIISLLIISIFNLEKLSYEQFIYFQF